MKLVRVGFITLAVALTASAAQAQQATPPRMPHPVAGKEQCLTCHAANANPNIGSQPASHQFPVTACAMCHQPRTNAPPAVPHATTEAFQQCRTCHVANSPMGAPAVPAFHGTWPLAVCGMCHLPAQRGR